MVTPIKIFHARSIIFPLSINFHAFGYVAKLTALDGNSHAALHLSANLGSE